MEEIHQYKCGYCGFLIHTQCENLLEHECFVELYQEELHDLTADDGNILTVGKETRKILEHIMLNAETLYTYLLLYCFILLTKNTGVKVSKEYPMMGSNWEETFIKLVQDRPALYNIQLPLLQRTNAKKTQLWNEISNIYGGKISSNDLAKKWKYLRDCYNRAKKKVTEYKPSGSQAMSIPDPGFRHYYLMKFIDDGASQQLTVSSVEPKSGSSIPSTRASTSTMSETLTPLTSPTEATTPRLKRQKNDEKKDLENKILDVFTSSQTTDGVDGFLIRLGESLRRFPYRERAKLEIEILQKVFETEERLGLN